MPPVRQILPSLGPPLASAFFLAAIELLLLHEPEEGLGKVALAMLLLGIVALAAGRIAKRWAPSDPLEAPDQPRPGQLLSNALRTRAGRFSFGVYAFGLCCGFLASAFAFGGVYLVGLGVGVVLSLVGATLMVIVMLLQGLAALSTPPR